MRVHSPILLAYGTIVQTYGCVLAGFHFYCKAPRYEAKCVQVQQLATRQMPNKWSHRNVIEEICRFILSVNALFIV